MVFKYLAVICGGIGPDVWDRKVEVSAGNISEALQLIEKDLGYDEIVVSIEQWDY